MTGRLAVVAALSPPTLSTATARASRVNSPLKPGGGVRVRPFNWSGVRVTLPSGFTAPADSVAPSGKPLTVTESVSEPSVSASADAMSSAIAESSSPFAACTTRLGASASPDTVTGSDAAVTAAVPDSVAVARSCRTKSASLSSGGVTVNPSSWSGVRATLPSGLTVPADSAAPSGKPLTMIDRVSDPSVSASADAMSRAIALSSAPAAARAERLGASATAETDTGIDLDVVADAPDSPSVAVTMTCSEKSASLFAGGVRVSPSS